MATRTKLLIPWECLSPLIEAFTLPNSPINLMTVTSPAVCATAQHIEVCTTLWRRCFQNLPIILRFAERMERLEFYPLLAPASTKLLKKIFVVWGYRQSRALMLPQLPKSLTGKFSISVPLQTAKCRMLEETPLLPLPWATHMGMEIFHRLCLCLPGCEMQGNLGERCFSSVLSCHKHCSAPGTPIKLYRVLCVQMTC